MEKKDIVIGNINLTNPVEGKEEEVINAFVEFYGEQHRAEITERIKSTKVLVAKEKKIGGAYYSNLVKEKISSVKKRAEENIFADVFEKIGLPKNNVLWLRAMTYDELVAFETASMTSLIESVKSNKENYEKLDDTNKANVYNFLRICGFDGVENVSKENFEQLLLIANNFDKIRNKDVSKEKEKIEKAVKEAEITAKNNDIFDKEYFADIVEDLKNEVCVYLDGFDKLSPQEQTKVAKGILYLNYGENLNDSSVAVAQKFFNLNKKTLRYKMCDKIADRIEWAAKKNKKREIADLYYYCVTLGSSNNEIKNLFLKDGIELSSSSEIVSAIVYQNSFYPLSHGDDEGVNAYYMYLATENNKPAKLIVIHDYKDMQLFDQSIMHELGHSVSSSYVAKNGHVYEKCGIMNSKYEYNSCEDLYMDENQKYDALNEVINDYFSIEINGRLNLNGGKITLNEYYETSIYAEAFPVFAPFIEKYKNEIKEAYISSNPNAFIESFGKKNFEDLADLADECLENVDCYDNSTNQYYYLRMHAITMQIETYMKNRDKGVEKEHKTVEIKNSKKKNVENKNNPLIYASSVKRKNKKLLNEEYGLEK